MLRKCKIRPTLHCTFGSILTVRVQCRPSCSEELNLNFCSQKMYLVRFASLECWVKHFERALKFTPHKPSCVICQQKRMLVWCNIAKTEITPNKTFLKTDSLGVLHDCPDPKLCHRYSFSSSVPSSVHSLIPMSNFSKCASITCWTIQKNTEFYWRW